MSGHTVHPPEVSVGIRFTCATVRTLAQVDAE